MGTSLYSTLKLEFNDGEPIYQICLILDDNRQDRRPILRKDADVYLFLGNDTLIEYTYDGSEIFDVHKLVYVGDT